MSTIESLNAALTGRYEIEREAGAGGRKRARHHGVDALTERAPFADEYWTQRLRSAKINTMNASAHNAPSHDAPRSVLRAAVTYRDTSRGGALRTTTELSRILQLRLRYLALWFGACTALFTFAIVAMLWREIVARPMSLFTEPPLLGWQVILMLIIAVVAWQTSPGRQVTLTALRWLEAMLFLPGFAFFAVLHALVLYQGLPTFAANAAWIAPGSSAFWIVAMFAYAVQIPNSWQRCAVAMSVIALCALGPDVVMLATQSVPVGAFVLYLALKSIWLGGAATLATYGAHRIDALTLDANNARRLGQYTLGERIGAGGMGEVYRAEHQFLRRPCVVKLIRPGMDGASDMLARFEREVQSTAALTHPNTVQVFDYGRADDGTFFYVMEYLPGESLDVLVARSGPLAPTLVVHVLTQICGALHEAHGAGMLHRDIKPANVILCERGGIRDFAKILDFGLAGPIMRDPADASVTQAGMLLGTPDYMSPEQIGGEELSVASDIYAIGALAYFMLTGRVLFERKMAMQTLAAHLYEAPPEAGGATPAGLERIIRRCLAKAPADRFASALELEHALRASSAVRAD